MFFALKQAWNQRKHLKKYLTDPHYQIHSLEEITPARLDALNVAVLVLDFDGVLAPHGEQVPSLDVQKWLSQLAQSIGEQRLAILTNSPSRARVRYFGQHFPSIHVVKDVRKKPYPDGLQEIAQYRGVDPHRVLLVDDRLTTGMLAVCLAYSRGWYFHPPRSHFKRRPLQEIFFFLLRGAERSFIKLFA